MVNQEPMNPSALFEGLSHIIFDLDGLLVDSEILWQVAESDVLARYGKVWNAEIAKSHIGLRLDEAVEVMIAGYGLDVSLTAFEEEIFNAMIDLILAQLEPMMGANEIITAFAEADLTLAIASSSTNHYIQTVVDKMAWGDVIGLLASAEDVPMGKPAPDVYLLAAEKLGANPANCLALEDSVNGAKAARSAGMRTVAIPGHEFSPADFDGIAHAIYPTLTALQADFEVWKT